MRYFIQFCYDGGNYHGWQVQPNGQTVQAQLQDALSQLLRCPIEVVGAGRTDTGVHAREMWAHFDFDQELDTKQLLYRLNRFLPRDIAVFDVRQVADGMHARFSAKSRTYHYYIHTRKLPFRRQYSCEFHQPLDFVEMNKAAAYLLTQSDFAAFCKAHTDVKTTLCEVTVARWVNEKPDCWYFEIKANRFLRNMVRAVVGTLVEVGRGRINYETFCGIVESKKRTNAGESMPANALFLESVEYDFT